MLEARTARHLAAGETAPRFHATSRPPYVEAEATGRAIALARAADAPLYVVHLSCAEALAAVRAARAEGLPVLAETCPHYLTLTDERYDRPPEEAARYVISPPLRGPGQPAALWAGLAAGDLALVATDHVPDRVAVEKQSWRESFDRISNGGPGIETLLGLVYSEGVAGRPDQRRADGRPPGDDAGAAVRSRIEGRGRGRAATPTWSCSIPAARRTLRAADLHHTSDYTPYEGLPGHGRRPVDDRPGDVRRPGWPVRRPARLRAVRGAPPRADGARPSRVPIEERVRAEGQELGEIVGQHEPSSRSAASPSRPAARPPWRASSSSRIAVYSSAVIGRPSPSERPVLAPLPQLRRG